MAYATATTTPISGYGFSAEPCDGGKGPWWDVMERPDQEICLEEGEFLLKSMKGSRLIGEFTGRKRWVNSSTYAPTINVYEVDTVVEMVGDLPVIVGRRGNRIKGTWWTSPKAVLR